MQQQDPKLVQSQRLATRGSVWSFPRAAVVCVCLGAAGCTSENAPDQDRDQDVRTLTRIEQQADRARARRAPEYMGIETRLLDGDLVSFVVHMRAAEGAPAVAAYAECAAAQYALIRGYGFARHVRTNVQEANGIWRGDAVYTISAALPEGYHTIDAEVTAASCTERGIPTV